MKGVEQIAARHRRTIPQIIFRFAIQVGRGADPTCEIAADNPVNTKRRDLPLLAFLRYPKQYQRLASTPPQTENCLSARRDTPKTPL
jgi:hypothetical protein